MIGSLAGTEMKLKDDSEFYWKQRNGTSAGEDGGSINTRVALILRKRSNQSESMLSISLIDQRISHDIPGIERIHRRIRCRNPYNPWRDRFQMLNPLALALIRFPWALPSKAEAEKKREIRLAPPQIG